MIDTCFNCGEPGHFASSCPDKPRPRIRSTFHAPPRRADQDAINERGMAKVRAALAGDWAEFERIVDAEIAAR